MTSSSARCLMLTGVCALAATTASAQTTLFTDNFESDSSASYTVVDDGVPDGTQTFAFDYIAAGIPLAPRSTAGDTGGLRLTANDTLGSADAVTVFHNTPVVESHYRLTVDVFMNWNPASTSGTTEFAHVGIGGDGATFNQVFLPISGSGAFLSFTGDGGSGSDYRWFRDPLNTPPGDTSSTTLPNSHPSYLGHGSNNSGSFFQALFPSPPSTIAGSPGNIWTTVEVDVDNNAGVISYYLDGVLTFQGSFAGSFDGQVSLGMADVFSSLSAAMNNTLYDNLLVEAVDPAATVCTQSVDNTVETGGIVHCANAGISTENQWLRRYSPSADCGLTGDVIVTAVNYAVSSAVGVTGSQEIVVRVYEIAAGAQLIYANMTLLSEEPQLIVDQASTLMTANLSTKARISAGNDVVVEIAKLTPLAAGDTFIAGGNDLGETGTSYIASTSCGLNEPTPLGAIGFPDAHLILDPVYTPDIGMVICGPNTPNSTGASATICALGSANAIDNDLVLRCQDMPSNSFVFVLASMTQGMSMPANSMGFLCLDGDIGRGVGGLIGNTGMTGTFSFTANLAAMPQPMGSVPTLAGDTWFFQAWFRDSAGGVTTSNLTDAVSVQFN